MPSEMERGSRLALERDAKYVSELSTVMVATIQETKDRISLIEHIFCSDLFPNIQSKWKSMQEVYSDAQKAAEDLWKEKEMALLYKIEELEAENQKLIEENKGLDNSVTEKKQDGYLRLLIDTQKCLQQKINELEVEVQEKSNELKKAQESADSLLYCAERDGRQLVEYENQLNEEKRKSRGFVEALDSSKKDIIKLQEELRKKVRDVDEAKVLREDLWRKLESQNLKITNYESSLKAVENEMKLLQAISLKQLNESASETHEKFEIKSKEVDEGKKVQQQLAQQIEHKNSQLLALQQHLEDQQCQNSKLLLIVKELEERVEQLQAALQDSKCDLESKEASIKKLNHSIVSHKRELMSEKTHDIYLRYKKLKSQYLYLLHKTGLTLDSVPTEDKEQAKLNSVINAHSTAPLTDMKSRDQNVDATLSHAIKQKDDSRWNTHQNNEERVRSGYAAEGTSDHIGTSKKIKGRKTSPRTGTKRPASGWRDTRSHQNQDGPDPHDDFLNTPLENIRENLNKGVVEEVCDLPDNVQLEVNLSSSDDEVQKSAFVDSKRQQKQPLVPNSKGYKFVEPVRKKADRDNLKGIECKQCKKFYDAVLPNDASGENNLRCEHHDGVSRHRYKYIPPSTPEGFWNIGFDTEN